MPEVALGIDYGSKRIGLAMGQTMTQTARPLQVLTNNKGTMEQLLSIIKEWRITQLIIGLPLDMDGEEQEITRQTRNFANKLQHQSQLPVTFVDERLTSYEAERQFQHMRATQQAKAKDKRQMDAVAAQIILQSWLDQQ